MISIQARPFKADAPRLSRSAQHATLPRQLYSSKTSTASASSLRSTGWRCASLARHCCCVQAMARASSPAETAARSVGADSYDCLQTSVLNRTRNAGFFLVVYLWLQASTQAAVCGAAGACGSWLYLQQIVMEINNVSADSEVPMKNAKMIRMQPFRALAMVAAGYRQAMRPRLLIPITLFASFTVYRQLYEQRLGLIEAGALLAGFLSFKAALLLVLWDDNKPTLGMGKAARHQRPRLTQFSEIEEP